MAAEGKGWSAVIFLTAGGGTAKTIGGFSQKNSVREMATGVAAGKFGDVVILRVAGGRKNFSVRFSE